MIFALARRHLKLFFRDRMMVFFALLSPLIMVALYAFFLGNVQVEDLTEAFPSATASDIDLFIASWVLSGIIMITALTTGLAALTVFVEDRASDRFKDFVVSPITKRQLILSYLLSIFIIALLMSTIVLAFSQAYIAATGGELLNGNEFTKTYGYIILLCAGFAALSSFVVTFIKSTSAFTTLNVIIGTAVGFLAGIYIQPGSLGSSVVNVMNVLPFSQAAALLRQPFTTAPIDKLAVGNSDVVERLHEHYGIGNLQIGNFDLTVSAIIYIFLAITVVFTLLGAWRLGKKIN